jgi:hypothetical protein
VSDLGLVADGTTRARSVAVPVDSWDEYVERFGSFEGRGLLPHAVFTYFAQGGRRAFVVRIVHNEAEIGPDGAIVPLGRAAYRLTVAGLAASSQPVVDTATGDPVLVWARDEGTWGNRLRLALSFFARPIDLRGEQPGALLLAQGARLPASSLLRVHGAAGELELRWARAVERRGRVDSTEVDLYVILDTPAGFPVVRAEEVTTRLDVTDDDPTRRRQERHDDLGLQPAHPRFLADVVNLESRLVEISTTGVDVGDPSLPLLTSTRAVDGVDRWSVVTPADVFGRVLEGDDRGVDGLDALLAAPEVATVVVPDLYSPAATPVTEPFVDPGVGAGPSFRPCVDVPPVVQPPAPTADLVGLRLDPTLRAELETIISLQQQLVETATRLGVVTLLDVPPGIRPAQVQRWRARFDSSWAAAYHPWLRSPTLVRTGVLVDVPPSAAAAGIIARCERRSGVPKGPAHEFVAWAVDVAVAIDDRTAGELHRAGIDVVRFEPRGIWLVGARTLSSDRQYRQLTVRRILQLLMRSVARQLQWTVFEPNDGALRAGLRRAIEHLLYELFDRGAFAGATPATSWFVHIASGPDAAREADRGQLIIEIGIAPSEPIEYILLRVVLGGDGELSVAEQAGPGLALHA